MMITLGLGRFSPPLTRVMTHVARSGPLPREELVRRTGLSASTVGRAVSTLVAGRLLRERPDLLRSGVVGRPSLPVDLDSDHFVTLGCHVGRRTTTVSLGDLGNRVLARTELPTPYDGSEALAREVAARLTGLLAQHPHRVALGAGLVAAWGDIDHDRAALGDAVRRVVGLPTETWELIPAMAAAECLARPDDLPGSTLYLYCRDTVGFVMANQRPAGTEIARVGRLGHFPAGGPGRCRCGRTGCLEAAVSDQAVSEAAVAAGVVPVPEIARVVRAASQGHRGAHALLLERAETLGRVAAVVCDMVVPDWVVLFGQGFTAYPPALDVARDALAAARVTPGPLDVRFTRFAGDVQSVAAGTVALRPIYGDPERVIADHHLADHHLAEVGGPRARLL